MRTEEFSKREESTLAHFLGIGAIGYSKIIKTHYNTNFYHVDRGTKLINGFH